MTDVQVSNARRVGFTALALVAFWVGVFAAHDLAYGGWQVWHSFTEDPDGYFVGLIRDAVTGYVFHEDELPPAFYPLLTVVPGILFLAFLPTAFVSLSAHNVLFRVRSSTVLVCAFLFTTTIASGYWLGTYNAVLYYRDYQARQVSVLWLLPPLILTTAFVIFGAWRRAVRDAEVEVVDEEHDYRAPFDRLTDEVRVDRST